MSNARTNPLHQAISAALSNLTIPLPPLHPPAPQSAASRHNAPHPTHRFSQTNPTPSPPPSHPPRPLSHRQILALQFLAAGNTLTDTAASLRLHRYTLTRWLKNPLFQSELDRHLSAPLHAQVTSATKRHIAPQSAAAPPPFLPNEPTQSAIGNSQSAIPRPSRDVPKHYTLPSPNDAPNKEL